jgi:hypothetical protein
MMVIRMAITPSLKASNRPLLIVRKDTRRGGEYASVTSSYIDFASASSTINLEQCTYCSQKNFRGDV